MALILKSDEALSDPLPNTPVALYRWEVSVTDHLVARWSARTFLEQGAADDMPVALWPSYQGEDVDLTQSTPTRRPLLKLDGIGGRAALLFDETASQHMLSGNFASAVPTPMTVCSVIKPTTGDGAGPSFLGGNNNTHYFTMFRSSNTKTLRYHTAGGSQEMASAATVDVDSTAIVIAKIGGTDISGLWVNAYTRSSPQDDTSTTDDKSSVQLDGVDVGGARNLATNTWNGYIAETLVYSDHLDSDEIATLLDELGAYYGVEIGS